MRISQVQPGVVLCSPDLRALKFLGFVANNVEVLIMIQLVITNVLVVLAAVMTHYESLHRLSSLIPRIKVRPHLKLIFAVCGALLAHTLEVWLFAFAYFIMLQLKLGYLVGKFDGSLSDCFYFSLTTFTTLGFGDIDPVGPLRYLTGFEALTGLVLITWTASFLFVEMERYWERR